MPHGALIQRSLSTPSAAESGSGPELTPLVLTKQGHALVRQSRALLATVRPGEESSGQLFCQHVDGRTARDAGA
jgi:hypothetical protein